MTFGGAGHPLGERFMARLRDEARGRMIASIRDKVHIDSSVFNLVLEG